MARSATPAPPTPRWMRCGAVRCDAVQCYAGQCNMTNNMYNIYNI